MTVWHNAQYDKFEKNSSGDPYRGLPKIEFPWVLANTMLADLSGDHWTLQITCTGFKTENVGNFLDVSFELKAWANIRPERVTQLGFDSQRISLLNSSILKMEVNKSTKMRLPFVKIQAAADLMMKKFRLEVRSKYSDADKAIKIRNEAKNRPFGRFSEK